MQRRDLVVYKTAPAKVKRWGWVRTRPIEVIVVEGCAVAVYEDDGSVQYRSLDELLEDHALRFAELIPA